MVQRRSITRARFVGHVKEIGVSEMDLIIGQAYSREELNAFFGAPLDCECRIVEPGHVCDSDD